jgi:predicted Zn-ribbon and HTH transcriptional regulator
LIASEPPVTADQNPERLSETEVPHSLVIQVTATGDTQEVEHALDVAGLNKARTIIGELAKAWSGDIFGPDLTPDEWQQVCSAGIPVERIATACYRHALHVVLLHLPEDPPPTILDLEDRFFDGQTLPDTLVDFDHVHSTTGVCVKAPSGNFCAPLNRSHRLSDPTADHTPERLSEEEREGLIEAIQNGDQDAYVEAILAARLADQAARLAAIEALHVRRESNVYDDVECAEGDCDHPDGTCVVLSPAVCAHCADQTEPGGAWEHCIREAAFWPCATIRALHPNPDQERTNG